MKQEGKREKYIKRQEEVLFMLLIDKIGIGTGNRGKIGRLDNRLVLFEKVFVLCWKLGMNE